ncbi:MAG: hypothetical protein AVO33_08280 [delta proteobacterium ML8_F1]|nr:MAG: hypothetical protein AVO33_08280 [delta proteobacterium ML8_F1]
MKIIYSEEGRDQLVVNNSVMLTRGESLAYLDLQETVQEPTLKINRNYEHQLKNFLKSSYRVALVGLGDVGANLLLGLKLFGAGTLEEVGLYNPDERVSQRYALEMNQIYQENFDLDVKVVPLQEQEIFRADVVIFTASGGVPPIGEEKVDVRKAQYLVNAGILSRYVAAAVKSGFKGLFLVVSDPVDLLCKVALEKGSPHLLPSQIAGFGQGVMYARARLSAENLGITDFKEQGRIYGPHGSELVVANSLSEYDEPLSMELTRLTVEANLRIRALGFKPFIAPAFSSGALSILSYLRGQPTYSSQYLGGYYFGTRGRLTADGFEFDVEKIPGKLMARLESSYKDMVSYYEKNPVDQG